MATSTQNSITVETIAVPADNIPVASLVDGKRWGTGGAGAGVSLTYSFPTTSSTYNYNYEWSSGSTMTGSEQQAVRDALAEWSAVANIEFVEVADNASVVGELRFAESVKVDEGVASAWASLPANYPSAGDVWVSPTLFDASASDEPGSWNFMTLMHEIGHALGLKHPFDTGVSSTVTLPEEDDYYNNSLMTNCAKPGAALWMSMYPATPMLYDIAAIQYVYGANMDYNSGDTTYAFYGNAEYFETIWDGGGTDTIVYYSTTDGVIDLRDGNFSQLGEDLDYGDNTHSADTVAIAFNCEIECATGGLGDDSIIGNGLANDLIGNSGADSVSGGDGEDRLYGNDGQDILTGDAGGDALYAGLDNGTLYGEEDGDTLFGGRGNDVLVGGLGDDTLSGDDGDDLFCFTATGDGVDVISDFGFIGHDKLLIDASAFGLNISGALSAASLVSGRSPVATAPNDYVLFNTSNGSLWLDADGNGAGAAVQIATLSDVTSLSTDSFVFC